MPAIINTAAAVLTVLFGLIGFIAPRYTAAALDLVPGDTTMGLSEMRASVGGLFVVAGAAALWIGSPTAYAMLGFIYAGAALGRTVSLMLDSPPLQKALLFGGIEAVLAIWLLVYNLNRT